jgi:hypothetical protein
MAFLFTSTQQTKLGLAILFIAILSLTNLTAQNHTATKVATNTSVNQKMQWVYGGYRFTLNIPLGTHTYNYYKRQSKRNSYASYAQEHIGYAYLSQLAKQLKIDADELGYTAFVQQNITYTKDPYNNGFDYPKYPIETLVEKKGDCEDSAILLVALLKLFNFDALLIQVPSHMAVGIACDNCSSYYNFEGEKYAYIETTNPKWEIGNIPSEYKKASAQLIKTPYLKPIKVDKTVIPQPKKNECTCEPKKQVKTITIEGKRYTIKPNETIEVKQNGVTIRISN